MNKYVKLTAGIVLFVLLIFGANVLYGKLTSEFQVENEIVTNAAKENDETDTNDENISDDAVPEESQEKNIAAMDFSVQDMEGNTKNLLSFVGRPIVVNFWASWCTPCKSELPDFQTAYEEYGEEIEFLMVNLTDGSRVTVETAKNFIESEGYTFPLYFDTAQEAAYTYGVYSIPMTFFIDAEGNIAAYANGMINGSTLEEGIGLIYQQ